ncbi:protein 5NUC-like isoform X2 [Chelonus insularis]|nr:protein 5NUC-like isoform X2 [Chelonus insularis]
MHSRFDEISSTNKVCSSEDSEAGKCYGGFARIATLVREARNSSSATLFLNAGDSYQGSNWFFVHKWKIVSEFLNILQPNVVTLGNHEFDNGVEGLIPFITHAQFPIVVSNLDLSNEPLLSATKIKKSVILTVAGRRIGVIGYLTPDTQNTSNTGNVQFLDEVQSIKKEVKKLQANGVNILIALGHSGFSMDKKIAAKVDGLDLVIGGHTNTFLYNGKPPGSEKPEGPYPVEVEQKTGRKVYVVQAYAYTKYLGDLSIKFDAKGEIIKIKGNPILVDSSIQKAQDVVDELEKWRPAVENLTTYPVGSSKVFLEGKSVICRKVECNLGNLIVDAMIDYNMKDYKNDKGYWTDAAIAMHNSGTIKDSINKMPDEDITVSDIMSVLPFSNDLVKLEVSGKQILQVLEHSVYQMQLNYTEYYSGAFMHYSGIQVIYDLNKPSGSRVVPGSVYVRCASCRVPVYEQLENNKMYTILTIDYLRKGGDGYKMWTTANWTRTGITTDEVLIDYFRRRSPVFAGVERRIQFFDHDN